VVSGAATAGAAAAAGLKISNINININMGSMNLGNLALNMPSLNIGNLDFSLGDLGLDDLDFEIGNIGDINIPDINIDDINVGDFDFDFDFDLDLSSLDDLSIDVGAIGSIDVPDIDLGKLDMKDLGVSGIGAIGSDLAGKVGDPCGSSTPSEDACDLGETDSAADILSDFANASNCPADESVLTCATNSIGLRGVPGPTKIKPWAPTYRDLRRLNLKDSHHIIQHAAVMNVPGYSHSDAPAIHLPGPSNKFDTPHNKATRIQQRAGGGTYGEELRIAICALYAAGCTQEEIDDAVRRSNLYFKGVLKLTDNSPLRIPKNRRKK